MFTLRNKYHQECAEEAKINKNDFPIWVEQQDVKISGFIKLLDHTLIKCDRINHEIQIGILELKENYNILKRNFFKVAALYFDKASEKQYKYILLLLNKLNTDLKDLQDIPRSLLKEHLSIQEWKTNINSENLIKGAQMIEEDYAKYKLEELLRILQNPSSLTAEELERIKVETLMKLGHKEREGGE